MMRKAEVPVTFQPAGKTVNVLDGSPLIEAAIVAGIVLDQPCGGMGTCGKCRLIVLQGLAEPCPAERELLSQDQLEAGLRLACQSLVCGPTSVEVPAESLLDSPEKILVRSEQTLSTLLDPVVKKQYVDLSVYEMRSAGEVSELDSLRDVLGPFDVDPQLYDELLARLRQADLRGTAVLTGGRLIDFEPHDTAADNLAVAVDVGTTTLAAALLDGNTAKEFATTSRLNPQIRFGDDVLTRIRHVSESSHGLAELHETVIRAVDEMIGELVDRAGTCRERVYTLTFSGNTTMQHLLCDIDPSPLGRIPFVPATGHGEEFPASELRLHVHSRATAYVSPIIGGFVGGDTVSGILATALVEAQRPTLLVDIGTNGEIVLWANGQLTAASTAAGPAFEGARISHGMRAARGAIEKVLVEDQLLVGVIGNVRPVGLCGSALIDLAAELLRHGILGPEGRLRTTDQLPDGVAPDLARRVIVDNGQLAFLLVSETESDNGRPIVLSQRDIRELQLATGAIRAGIILLLRRAGLQPDDLDAVWIAGGFGNFIRRSNAQRIGLLPWQIPRHRIRFRGNTSLAGAQLMALASHARAAAEQLAMRTQHVDLSREDGFQDVFAEAMFFPSAETE